MTSLLPPNASAFEKSLEQTTRRLAELDVPIRELWNPQTCPVHMLPWLAWALSVDQWDNSWSESVKRDVIDKSLIVHRQKGTEAAVKSVVQSVFSDGSIIQASEFNGAPHNFKVATSGLVDSGTAYQSLATLVGNSKPARSHMVAVVVKREASQALNTGAVVHSATHITITP